MQSLSLFTHAHVVGRKGDERRRDSRSKRYRPVSLARALARSLCVRCGQNLHFFLPKARLEHLRIEILSLEHGAMHYYSQQKKSLYLL